VDVENLHTQEIFPKEIISYTEQFVLQQGNEKYSINCVGRMMLYLFSKFISLAYEPLECKYVLECK
jgi:hypothetical protein